MIISTIVATIARSAGEQAAGLKGINGAMNGIDTATQRNAAMVEENTAEIHGLRGRVIDLSYAAAHKLGYINSGSAEVEVAVAVTGIAGPGGSAFKPEGRVCFGLAQAGREVFAETVEFGALGRAKVRQAARDHALAMLLRAMAP